ncbi:MAG: zinc metallopeptidase [Verrucomicrobia bacterium]|nr:MAG: zinc metallopeptidase [Verrucomicrobiota bacterium]
MFFDPLYFKLVLPGLALALLATWLTKSTFAKYARVAASSGLTGAEAAERLLASQGISGVTIREHQGFLSDHYDPRDQTLNLSPEVYGSRSLAAIGVACHEAGHAIQHAKLYAPLKLRTELVPITNFGSNFSYIIFIAGMMFHSPMLFKVGVLLFMLTVVFAIVTLPVEWDASRRAKALMVRAGIVTPQEQSGAASVLNAAFLTYVASAVTALLTLLYYLLRSGMLGGRRD